MRGQSHQHHKCERKCSNAGGVVKSGNEPLSNWESATMRSLKSKTSQKLTLRSAKPLIMSKHPERNGRVAYAEVPAKMAVHSKERTRVS